MKKQFLILSIICLLLLASCSEKKFDDPIAFDEEYLNKQIQLIPLDYADEFATNKSIFLELSYNTKNEIRFPNNFNFRIFSKTSDGWVEIPEIHTKRIPAGDIIFSPNIDLPYPYVVNVFPDYQQLDKKYKIRIYVSGDMLINSETITVAAYSDIVVLPALMPTY
jgi:hypothetical protein